MLQLVEGQLQVCKGCPFGLEVEVREDGRVNADQPTQQVKVQIVLSQHAQLYTSNCTCSKNAMRRLTPKRMTRILL